MDLDEIKQILELMREHELAELELEQEHVKLRLRKHTPPHWGAVGQPMPPMAYAPPGAPGPPAVPMSPGTEIPAPVLTAADDDVDFAIVKSPIVGTFYRSAEPGAKPYVDVGETVRKGQVLCIIEAMKLMNEINAECDGEIVKAYVENGHAVQYGERLFAIKPSAS
jgi:acetyl-CoA carboxylase biotin carboxyl carrier protein